jgi:cytochrome c oxidase assembly factor CtaG
MDSTTRLLTSWEFRPEVILILLLSGGLYLAGWLRLRHRGRHQLATYPRLASYFAGLTILAIALLSAIDILGGFLFFMHMIQHLLMLSIIPVLLWLAEPFPIIFWALPRPWQKQIGRLLFSRRAPFRHFLRWLSAPGLIVLIFLIFVWGWHDPNAYNAALRIPWVHDLQHVTFFLPAMLGWWKAIGAAPHFYGRATALGRAGQLLATAVVNMIPGVAIAMSRGPIYTYYLDVPRIWGITVMNDQIISGVIMWIPGTMMYIIAILAIIGRKIAQDNEGNGDTRSAYLTKADLRLP